MKTIELALQPITGYLILMARDTINGWYEIEIGLPLKWVFASNDDINCEILIENDLGRRIKISPKNQKICIDDLILFVETIINVNQQIEIKENEFTDKMIDMKNALEKEAKKFYEELDNLKEKSLKNFCENVVKKEKAKKSKSSTGNTGIDIINKEIVNE